MARRPIDQDDDDEDDGKQMPMPMAETPFVRAEADERVQVVITADHMYLPLDIEGNVPAKGWESVQDTVKVTRRQRLKMPKALAQSLSDQERAEIL